MYINASQIYLYRNVAHNLSIKYHFDAAHFICSTIEKCKQTNRHKKLESNSKNRNEGKRKKQPNSKQLCIGDSSNNDLSGEFFVSFFPFVRCVWNGENLAMWCG